MEFARLLRADLLQVGKGRLAPGLFHAEGPGLHPAMLIEGRILSGFRVPSQSEGSDVLR